MEKIKVSAYKREIAGKIRKVSKYKRPKRPAHGKKRIKHTKLVEVTYFTDQYGQIHPERKWKVIRDIKK